MIVGDAIPDSLIPSPPQRRARSTRNKTAASSPTRFAPGETGAPLGKSTFWMALTQMADVVTQSMGTGITPYTSERLMLASATAVLSITMRKRPRLRKWLVRLGTLGMGLFQGGSLVAVLGQAAEDPQLITSLAPNLAAQGVSLLAILKLFKAAGHRR
ncbi:MAG: hypothetical protein KDN19_12805 [Verrucomicrobiae bacterium]|nr:hypothetical protein [Verrucomicrobiae bacterium]